MITPISHCGYCGSVHVTMNTDQDAHFCRPSASDCYYSDVGLTRMSDFKNSDVGLLLLGCRI